MDDLIEALTIFRKYTDGTKKRCSCCIHDVFIIHIDPGKVSKADKKRLEELSFEATDEYGPSFASEHFGSC